jgi:hypothetical protein
MWLTTKMVLLLHEVLVVLSPKHEVECAREVKGVIEK